MQSAGVAQGWALAGLELQEELEVPDDEALDGHDEHAPVEARPGGPALSNLPYRSPFAARGVGYGTKGRAPRHARGEKRPKSGRAHNLLVRQA